MPKWNFLFRFLTDFFEIPHCLTIFKCILGHPREIWYIVFTLYLLFLQDWYSSFLSDMISPLPEELLLGICFRKVVNEVKKFCFKFCFFLYICLHFTSIPVGVFAEDRIGTDNSFILRFKKKCCATFSWCPLFLMRNLQSLEWLFC